MIAQANRWLLVGLGNPGSEYEGSRHNVGRDFLAAFEKSAQGRSALGGKILVPDTYMNNSGLAVKKFVGLNPSGKTLEHLVVLHDDLDLPLGKVKLSFGSGSGGHKGVESVQKALKTKDFVRVRIGISRETPGGKLKKPKGEDEVVAFVLGKFKPSEQEKLKKAKKIVGEALEILLAEGLPKATTLTNGR